MNRRPEIVSIVSIGSVWLSLAQFLLPLQHTSPRLRMCDGEVVTSLTNLLEEKKKKEEEEEERRRLKLTLRAPCGAWLARDTCR
eukprot:2062099-Prymnesium_polylepis.1